MGEAIWREERGRSRQNEHPITVFLSRHAPLLRLVSAGARPMRCIDSQTALQRLQKNCLRIPGPLVILPPPHHSSGYSSSIAAAV